MLLYWVVVVAAARALKMLAVCEAAPARFAASVLACPDGTGSARTCAAKVLKAAAARRLGSAQGPGGPCGNWPLCAIEIATPTSEAAISTDQNIAI